MISTHAHSYPYAHMHTHTSSHMQSNHDFPIIKVIAYLTSAYAAVTTHGSYAFGLTVPGPKCSLHKVRVTINGDLYVQNAVTLRKLLVKLMFRCLKELH